MSFMTKENGGQKQSGKRVVNKKPGVMLLGLLVLVVGLVTGCGNNAAPQVEEKDQGIPVETAVVTTRDIVSDTVLKGTLAPAEEVNLVPKASGNITAVYVAVGDWVNQGQVVCVLDSSDLQAQLLQAQASYNTVKSVYTNAVTNRDRMEILYNEGAISLQQLEQARSAVDQSGLAAAEAGLKAANDAIANCTVKATISGTVASVDAKVGNMASPSMPVARIVNTSKVKLSADITESNVNKIQEGGQVSVSVAAAGTMAFDGTVKSIAPASNPQTMTFPVEIMIPNSNGVLKAGMFGEATIDTETRRGVVAVPKSALSGDNTVYVVKADNTVAITQITTGLGDEQFIEVTSGLSAGDVVVTTGQHLVYDGALVRQVNAGEAATDPAGGSGADTQE